MNINLQDGDARDQKSGEPMADATVLVDSADAGEVTEAAGLGFVNGVTTNPTLMRKVTDNPLRHAEHLLGAIDLPEFYFQPCEAYSSLIDEAVAAWSMDPRRVIIKLPATRHGVQAASQLRGKGIRTALTAAQGPGAMIVAEAVGSASVIPYVDRAWRDPRVSGNLIAELAEVRRHAKILAASIKNIGQLTQAFSDGADAVSAPLSVLLQLVAHPAILEAEESFQSEYRKDSPLDSEAV